MDTQVIMESNCGHPRIVIVDTQELKLLPGIVDNQELKLLPGYAVPFTLESGISNLESVGVHFLSPGLEMPVLRTSLWNQWVSRISVQNFWNLESVGAQDCPLESGISGCPGFPWVSRISRIVQDCHPEDGLIEIDISRRFLDGFVFALFQGSFKFALQKLGLDLDVLRALFEDSLSTFGRLP